MQGAAGERQVFYLPPSLLKQMPQRARCSLVAVYSLIVASSKGGVCERTQASMARWLGCDRSTVKRHERQLAKLGLVKKTHHLHSNRRSLAIEREWGQNGPHSGDRTAPTLAPKTPPTARARSRALSDQKNPSQEGRAARADRKAAPSKEPDAIDRLSPAARARLIAATATCADRCCIWRQRLPELRGLVAQRLELRGLDGTISDLGFIADKNATISSQQRRGSMTMGWLSRGLDRLEEKRGRRGS